MALDDTLVGEICHIKGRKRDAARYDPAQTPAERNDYEKPHPALRTPSQSPAVGNCRFGHTPPLQYSKAYRPRRTGYVFHQAFVQGLPR
jgi:hypothetical protein